MCWLTARQELENVSKVISPNKYSLEITSFICLSPIVNCSPSPNIDTKSWKPLRLIKGDEGIPTGEAEQEYCISLDFGMLRYQLSSILRL